MIWRVHTDGGPEFQAEFHDWCVANGIHHTMSIPHTPQNNSRLERAHGTINAAIRSALHVSGLPLTFWDSAMMHSVFTLNRQPRWGTDGRLPTPFEMRYGKPYLGVDLVPFAKGEAAGVPHERLFWRSGASQSALVGGWKLDVSDPPGREWLFYLPTDPTEQNDLSGKRPDKLAELLAALAAHNAEQAPPAWPLQLTTGVNLDKDLSHPDEPDDEYIYWSN